VLLLGDVMFTVSAGTVDAKLLLAPIDVGIDEALVAGATSVFMAVEDALLFTSDAASSSSESESESESSLSDPPTVDGLLAGESGLSGPSSSFSSRADIVLATGPPRGTFLGTTFTGDGRRSW
jgi:hypothetical protein